VAINELLQAVLAILLRRPDDARARPGDYIRDDDKYKQVFGGNLPLRAYLSCAQLVRTVEDWLPEKNLPYTQERDIKFYMCAHLASMLASRSEPTADELAAINVKAINHGLLETVFDKVWAKYERLGANDQVAKGTELRKRLQKDLNAKFGRAAKRAVTMAKRRGSP
jgi:hypothetical protein